MAAAVRLLLAADSPGHTVGYTVVARGLRDAGIEVISGGHLLPRQIVQLALQEDVQWIGYRVMDGAPEILVPLLLDELHRQGADGVRVVVGGIVSRSVISRLKAVGVAEVFPPGSHIPEIAELILRQPESRDPACGAREREFLVTPEEWRAAIAWAKRLDAYQRRPPGRWPYVWRFKRPRLLLRWYDYAMGRVTGEADIDGRIRCTLLILGCTGEIKNPAAYASLREQFFSELVGRRAAPLAGSTRRGEKRGSRGGNHGVDASRGGSAGRSEVLQQGRDP